MYEWPRKACIKDLFTDFKYSISVILKNQTYCVINISCKEKA